MDHKEITRPDVRWKIICNLYDIISQCRGHDTDHDRWKISEYIEMLHDDLIREPENCLVALYGRDEVESIQNLLNVFSSVRNDLDNSERFTISAEAKTILVAAQLCLSLLLGEGRGLPGWNQDDPDFEPAVQNI